MDGRSLPLLNTEIPGPRSRALAGRLRRVESAGVTCVHAGGPIFWEEARGANVLDVDGNVYIDLTAGFGALAAGHGHRSIRRAAGAQVDHLIHALGDVHPARLKVEYLETLTALTPPGLSRVVLATSGAEAIEIALKTALLATGKPGVLAFGGAYHGLTAGALEVTWRSHFRNPFEESLSRRARFIPYPDPYRAPAGLNEKELLAGTLERARSVIRGRDPGDGAETSSAPEGPATIGAVLVEPVQGRAGERIPPRGFLSGLSALCREEGVLLILDEIFTGFGRTGSWFAAGHEEVAPDLLCLGKAMGGGFPLAACVGTDEVMSAWRPSTGEAVHTTTFLGHPVACAAGLAALEWMKSEDAPGLARAIGEELVRGLGALEAKHPLVGNVRVLGALAGVELVGDRDRKTPAADVTGRIVDLALRRGLILVPSGTHGNVVSITPPLTITGRQLSWAVEVLDACLEEASLGGGRDEERAPAGKREEERP